MTSMGTEEGFVRLEQRWLALVRLLITTMQAGSTVHIVALMDLYLLRDIFQEV